MIGKGPSVAETPATTQSESGVAAPSQAVDGVAQPGPGGVGKVVPRTTVADTALRDPAERVGGNKDTGMKDVVDMNSGSALEVLQGRELWAPGAGLSSTRPDRQLGPCATVAFPESSCPTAAGVTPPWVSRGALLVCWTVLVTPPLV